MYTTIDQGIVEPAKRWNLRQHPKMTLNSYHLLIRVFYVRRYNMAKFYTINDLKNISKKIYSTLLLTSVIQDFFLDNIEKNAYIFELTNGNIINLIFNEDQFCHLIGFSYFGYDGIEGWNLLREKSLPISILPGINNKKREEIRITNFNKIIRVLQTPNIYLYKNSSMSYKSDYFAIYDDGIRYYKLGIGTQKNGINYGETYQVSLKTAPDNKEINPENLLEVKRKFVISKNIFTGLYNRQCFDVSNLIAASYDE